MWFSFYSVSFTVATCTSELYPCISSQTQHQQTKVQEFPVHPQLAVLWQGFNINSNFVSPCSSSGNFWASRQSLQHSHHKYHLATFNLFTATPININLVDMPIHISALRFYVPFVSFRKMATTRNNSHLWPSPSPILMNEQELPFGGKVLIHLLFISWPDLITRKAATTSGGGWS